MKLKLISDETNAGTKLIDEDTGETVSGIQKISFEVGVNGKEISKVCIELSNIPVEITSKAEVDLYELSEDIGNLVKTKTFEKDIKIKTRALPGKPTVIASNVLISDAETDKPVGAIQNVKWEATPYEQKAKVDRIRFDNTDWIWV